MWFWTATILLQFFGKEVKEAQNGPSQKHLLSVSHIYLLIHTNYYFDLRGGIFHHNIFCSRDISYREFITTFLRNI